MVNQRGSYLKERNYLAGSSSAEPEKVSGKIRYWERIFGKEKVLLLAKENEKIRLHLAGVPYTLADEVRSPKDIEYGMPFGDSLTDILGGTEFLFAPFYSGILQAGLSRFREKKGMGGIPCSEQIEKDFVKYALGRMQKIAVRTLILEMRRLKEDGRLSGKDEAEEYQDFLARYLSGSDCLRRLARQYPLLFRMMEDQMEQCTDYFCQIIMHLEEDREAIQKQILGGAAVTGLSSICCMQGDGHHEGKSTALVRLGGTAEVYYKPRSLKNELIFQNILRKISGNSSLWDGHWGLKVVSRPDHGWEEKVCARDCMEEAEVKRFYERAGMLIFLARLLGTTDLHCENMIARGEYPVLIDLETLVSQQGQSGMQDEMSYSVLKGGILPSYLPDGKGLGNDVGALCGEGERRSKMLVPAIHNAYTSRMQVEYRHGVMGRTHNRVRLRGSSVEAVKYREDLVSGFGRAYGYVKESVEIQKYILEQIEGCKSRQVISDTMKYASLLSSSYHPDLMSDGGDREMFLSSVGMIGKARPQRLTECEVLAMLRGDIPYFYSEGKDLMCENEACIPDYFAYTPKEAVQERIARLSRRDEQLQEKLIRLSISVGGRSGEDVINCGQKRKDAWKNAMDRKNIDAAVLSVCEKTEGLILENVYEDEDGQLQILSMDTLEQSRSKIRRVSRYFYDGIAGVVLFLYALQKEKTRVSGQEPDRDSREYKSLERLLGQLKEYTENFYISEEASGNAPENSEGTGMFEGEFSIVFTYLLLYEIGREQEFLRLAELHAGKILPLLQRDTHFDLIGGNAGGICVLLKLYDITGEQEYFLAAQEAGDFLCTRAEETECGTGWTGSGDTPLCGMAHGNSGMLIAFSRLYGKTGEKRFYDACLGCLDYEDRMYEEEFHDWKDLRESAMRHGHANGRVMSWCHGAGGTALSRALAAEALAEKNTAEAVRLKKRLEEDIERAVPGLEKRFLRKGMCICHGTMGNYRILKKLRKYFAGSVMEEIRAEVYTQIMGWGEEDPDLLLQEYYSPGFMNGLAGIGYYLLGEVDEGLPDILEL